MRALHLRNARFGGLDAKSDIALHCYSVTAALWLRVRTRARNCLYSLMLQPHRIYQVSAAALHWGKTPVSNEGRLNINARL